MMSRKDYVAIAAAISNERQAWPKRSAPGEAACGDEFANASLTSAANRIADHLAADNPAFIRARFLKACGVAQ